MLIVRNTFVAKPGLAGQLALKLKDMVAAGGLVNARILTDAVTDFNQVVMEHEVESLAQFEETIRRYTSDATIQEKAKGYTALWLTGRREIFRVA
ncbi:MAG: hypothetical protein GC160_00945 [Acidobacteria bacterium]|nr:hypothetical protein [Acidobacteriota bacterium]